MATEQTVTIKLDVTDENPTLAEIEAFCEAAREHGADGSDIVDVRSQHLEVVI